LKKDHFIICPDVVTICCGGRTDDGQPMSTKTITVARLGLVRNKALLMTSLHKAQKKFYWIASVWSNSNRQSLVILGLEIKSKL
jgi:hypothetical protein